jgi:hypothetical protein
MRNNMNVTEYKVVGVYGAAENTYDIAAWDTLEEASGHANAIILNDCVIENMRYSRIEVVKVSEERVDISVKPTPKLFDPEFWAIAPDYERQGVAPKAVEVVDPKDFWEMVEILRNLEDRFVGLRNDVMLDIEAVQDDVDTLKDDAMATEAQISRHISALDDELGNHRNQLYALRSRIGESQ